MFVYNKLSDIKSINRVVVIGNFDGLHIGHQNLIKQGYKISKKNNLPLCVLTFFPQWQSVHKDTFKYLLTQSEKISFLERLGVDEIVSLPFNKEFASISAESFVEQILISMLCAKYVVVGFNFSFGKNAEGSPKLLNELLNKHDILLHIEKPYEYKENTVSSSLIRRQLKASNMTLVNELLGYPFHLCGRVIPGKQIGRTINFPTANIEYDNSILLPAVGVYAAQVWLTKNPSLKYMGVLNIGTRPTVDNSTRISIEIHILDFNEDIYGENICIEIYHFLRHISKFHDLSELKLAISMDVENTKKYFNK